MKFTSPQVVIPIVHTVIFFKFLHAFASTSFVSQFEKGEGGLSRINLRLRICNVMLV